jgi:hypothetical protein
MADLDMNFSLCDKGEKGFLATREARKMLINMGIPIDTANAYTKKRGYYTFKELIDKCQEIINEIAMLRSLYTAFRYTDIKTSDVDRYTGFVDYDFVATKMEEHGMMEDEIDLFLAPYHRVDGKLEYQRLLRDTFPGTYTSDLVEVFELGVHHVGKMVVPRLGGKPEVVQYNLGIGRSDLVKRHIELRQKLQEAVKTWDPDALADAIQQCAGPEYPEWYKGSKTYFPTNVIDACLRRMEELQKKKRDIEIVVARGNVEVDYYARIVRLLKPINFEPRSMPDDSAEFSGDMKEVQNTLRDVASILNRYREKMIIETRTEMAKPEIFQTNWAKKQAALVCEHLKKEDVSPELLKAKGEPGGGPSVAILPFKVYGGSDIEASKPNNPEFPVF